MHHVQSQSLACLSINGQVIDELVSSAKKERLWKSMEWKKDERIYVQPSRCRSPHFGNSFRFLNPLYASSNTHSVHDGGHFNLIIDHRTAAAVAARRAGLRLCNWINSNRWDRQERSSTDDASIHKEFSLLGWLQTRDLLYVHTNIKRGVKETKGGVTKSNFVQLLLSSISINKNWNN